MKKNVIASSPFSIYNASAGSGKTFTLVKRYLILLFKSKSPLSFRNILALTFTNKAVGEMKSRIIETLRLFSDEKILTSKNPMFTLISQELNIEPKQLREKSELLLETIVHNYAAFDISTIDKFNHKLIRVFANDLKLPVNFEVEIDTGRILNKAVENLIDLAGTNKELTRLLVDFAIDKADDDKSWDISYDFNSIAQLLINENELPYIETLKDKTLSDFGKLKKTLQEKIKFSEEKIVKDANTVLDLINSSSLEFSNFSRSTLPNHFVKASQLNFYGLYANKLEQNIIQRDKIYSQKLDKNKAQAIDALLPEIEKFYLEIKAEVFKSKLYSNALKNITPLSVLKAIQQSLIEIKESEDILLISEFNSIINSEIKNQPAPFIYERIGEKFKHYFIDEFQDTSVLQWENLVPLISSALLAENSKGDTGSLMIVGDAKQAIYRWRGGRAEQFINLYSADNPFFTKPNIERLPSNFRSFRKVVEFNNKFFKQLSEFGLTNENHAQLYRNSEQKFQSDNEGYVSIDFLNIEDESKDEMYGQSILDTINNAKSQGYDLKDICIIVRKKKEGIAIAEFLSEKAIPIISSETLMIKNSKEVNFLNDLILLNIQPKDQEVKVKLLKYLADQIGVDDLHSFLFELLPLETKKMFGRLNSYGYSFNPEIFSQLPIYEALESAIRSFDLISTSDAYVQFYLDEVFDYSQKHGPSFQGFHDHWEQKKDRLSIILPEGKEAVQIMTIHKSKGLEFPIVIFPYANQDIYFDLKPKIWFPVNPEEFNTFQYLYINLNKDLEQYSDLGKQVFENYRSNLELDSINLLYVVLTRAVEQLYIISELDLDKSLNEKINLYSGLFINYLKSLGRWNPEQLHYSFGEVGKTSEKTNIKTSSVEQETFISTKKEDHRLNIITNSANLWDSSKAEAIEKGNIFHDIMACIKSKKDVDLAFEDFENSGELTLVQSIQLKKEVLMLLNNSQIKNYYNDHDLILNEKDILCKNGKILRPDRLVINENKQVVIIDYKTGLHNPKHKEQLFDYQHVLEEMQFKVIKKFLVYVNDSITVKEF